MTTATYMAEFLLCTNVKGICFMSLQCYCIILGACCQQNVKKTYCTPFSTELMYVFQGKSLA